MVVIVYKVTVSAALINADCCSREQYGVRFLWVLVTLLSTKMPFASYRFICQYPCETSSSHQRWKKCPFTYTFSYMALSRESLPSLLMDSIFVNSPTHENFFITPKSIISMHLQSFEDILRDKNLSHPICRFSAEVEQDDPLLSCFSSHTINSCPFWVSI